MLSCVPYKCLMRLAGKRGKQHRDCCAATLNLEAGELAESVSQSEKCEYYFSYSNLPLPLFAP